MQKLLGDEVGEREVDGRHRDGAAAAAAAACATFVHQRVHQPGEKVALLLSEFKEQQKWNTFLATISRMCDAATKIVYTCLLPVPVERY